MYGIFATLYSHGDIFPPKMPSNIEELKTWDEHRVWIIYQKTLECNEVPRANINESSEVKQWRNTCKSVMDIWSELYEAEKLKEAHEKAKELNLPN